VECVQNNVKFVMVLSGQCFNVRLAQRNVPVPVRYQQCLNFQQSGGTMFKFQGGWWEKCLSSDESGVNKACNPARPHHFVYCEFRSSVNRISIPYLD
jgi:hypothetical protein